MANTKYLSLEGLQTFWNKIKGAIENVKVSVNDTAAYVDVSVDTTGRILSVSDNTLQTAIQSIEGRIGATGTITNRVGAVETKANDLQTAIDTINTTTIPAAEAAAKKHTDDSLTTLKGGYAGTLKGLDDAIKAISGDSGTIDTKITAALDKLDVVDGDATGTGYVSAVTQTDGKIAVVKTVLPTYTVNTEDSFVEIAESAAADGGKVYKVSTKDVASASALNTLSGKVDTNTTNISNLDKKVAALASATTFAGVVEWDPKNATVGEGVADDAGVKAYPITVDGVKVADLQNGDVVIKGDKEYVLDANNNKFVELGDTTQEVSRIGALETTINTEGTGLVDRVSALEDAVGGDSVVNSFAGKNGSILIDTTATGEGNVKFSMGEDKTLRATVEIGATAAQGAKADTAIQTAEAADSTNATVLVSAKDNKITVGVNVPGTTNIASGVTDLAQAGAVYDAIIANINGITVTSTTDTDITDIVTGMSYKDGELTYSTSSFTAITTDDINSLT